MEEKNPVEVGAGLIARLSAFVMETEPLARLHHYRIET